MPKNEAQVRPLTHLKTPEEQAEAWSNAVQTAPEGTLLIHPADAEDLGMEDGQQAKIITEAGEETIELEVSTSTRKCQVVMPHGFGLTYEGTVHGANVNRLTKNTHRDPWAATPLHRYVPCRVDRAERG